MLCYSGFFEWATCSNYKSAHTWGIPIAQLSVWDWGKLHDNLGWGQQRGVEKKKEGKSRLVLGKNLASYVRKGIPWEPSVSLLKSHSCAFLCKPSILIGRLRNSKTALRSRTLIAGRRWYCGGLCARQCQVRCTDDTLGGKGGGAIHKWCCIILLNCIVSIFKCWIGRVLVRLWSPRAIWEWHVLLSKWRHPSFPTKVEPCPPWSTTQSPTAGPIRTK